MLTRMVKAGDVVMYDRPAHELNRQFTVHHVRNGIAYTQPDERDDRGCFIAQFSDGGLNTMFTIVES